jgi:hypothetical protein
MQIGETKTDYTLITGGFNYAEVTVPAGETWEFVYAGASNDSNLTSTGYGPFNDNLSVGYVTSEGGNHKLVNGHSNEPPIGGEEGLQSLIVDGDVHSGLMLQSSQNDLIAFWTAVRIS